MPDQTSSDVIIRPAGPDQGDIAAQLMYSTHPVLHDDLYSGDKADVVACCKAIWESKEALESHSIAYGAYAGDALIGFEICGTMDMVREREHVDVGLVKGILSATAFEHYDLCFRDRWSYAFPRFPEETYYVGCLAVLPEWHGKGVGRLLLQDAFDRAKTRKCKDVQLDLYANNPALHFYQAMGMEKLSETTVMALQDTDTPTHYRMIKRFN
ncbi:MAG: GNAT family N-acetyltransferase [Alphaproteobacteria bacterium]|nr:MAG: GNAT family N-acetyltransferase [Alphaproteobacteria bacterium]